jgi:transposase
MQIKRPESNQSRKSDQLYVVYCCRNDKVSNKTNIVLYDYHNSSGTQCAIDFLDGYQGYMHVDVYKAYGLTEAKLVAVLRIFVVSLLMQKNSSQIENG